MIDRYTKVCLTVIAVSLAVIGLRGLPMIDPAWAQDGVQIIAICDLKGRCAHIIGSPTHNSLRVHNKGR